MLTQICLPSGSIYRHTFASGANTEASPTHLRDSAAVVETSQHICERNLSILMLACLHQRGRCQNLPGRMRNLSIMNHTLRFFYCKMRVRVMCFGHNAQCCLTTKAQPRRTSDAA